MLRLAPTIKKNLKNKIDNKRSADTDIDMNTKARASTAYVPRCPGT